MRSRFAWIIFFTVLFLSSAISQNTITSLPPHTKGPLPSARQLAWQSLEYYGFLHFSMNTFTDKEWGYGDEPESLFNPTDFDAGSIVRIASEAGMKGLILTCKHHDGFCLWPSRFTSHSVKNSPWKNGKGDVVKEVADACRKFGMTFGVYLSPWDRNSKEYGTPEYITLYRNQLTELLTNYGEIFEVWFDGANGGDGYYGGAREKRTIDNKSYYRWKETWELVRKLQPNAVMFSDGGPDVRWAGDEEGYAGETNWSLLRRDEVYPGYEQYHELISGHADGTHWVPSECDVSIRPGWFYHASEDTLVKSPETLFNLYCKSVGRNASLLLNIPPDRRGRLHNNDATSLMGFKKLFTETFDHNFANGASAFSATVRGNDPRFRAQNVLDDDPGSYWATDDTIHECSLTLELRQPTTFNCALLEEYIPLGQRVEMFSIDVWNGTTWIPVADGTTIGHKRLLRFSNIESDKIRFRITKSRGCPTIASIGLYLIPSMTTRDAEQH